MSRLDQHVAAVRNKLALGRFLQALAWTLAALGVVICLAVIIQRLTSFGAPVQLAWVALAFAVAAAIVWALAHRPGDHQAAVAIDDKLGLKEKFSTALHIRARKDAFAKAALLDAEQTAQRVNLARQFPLSFPRGGYVTLGVLAVLLATLAFFPRGLDVFGRQAEAQRLAQAKAVQQEAHADVARALTAVETLQKALPNNDEFTILQKDLDKILKQSTISDPGQAARKAIQAMNEVNDALAQQADAAARVAQAQQQQLFNNIPDTGQKGPVADAARDLKQGKFSDFLDDMDKATANFDKKSAEEQKAQTEQMAQLANQLQKMADDPQVQKQIQQKLQQQLGVNAQQAQQMAQAMQQAAAGNQAAQQQVAQMAQKAMQQLNNGAGPTTQQQQQMQQALSQMQGAANNQAQASALAQSMQQMASAMGQCQSQSSSSNSASGSKSGQSAGANPGGKNGAQSAAAQMASAQSAMQNAMGQMQAIQSDAASLAACQQCMGGNGNGNNSGNSSNSNPAGSPNAGQWGAGMTTGSGAGQGGPGIGNGGDGKKTVAPYGVKPESDPSQDDPNGKILASTFVKDQSIRGESKIGLTKIITASQKDLTDDVDSEATSGQARQTVEKYFQTVQQDAK